MTINKDELINKIEICFNQSGYEITDIIDNTHGAYDFIYKLETENIIRFAVSEHDDNGDYYLEAQYFSDAIGHSIIIDSDVDLQFETIDDFTNFIIDTEKEIDRIKEIINKA